MDDWSKSGKSRRFSLRPSFRRKALHQPSRPAIQTKSEPSVPTIEKSGDMQRATKRYLEATKLLDDAVKSHVTQWGLLELDFSEVMGEPGEFDTTFRRKIDKILEVRKNSCKDQTTWTKCR